MVILKMDIGYLKLKMDPHAKTRRREETIYKTISADYTDYTDLIFLTRRRGDAKEPGIRRNDIFHKRGRLCYI
jgi:hypothetical protein